MINTLNLKEVSVGYKKDFYALYNINLTFNSGENYLIVGDELSGKTTLLRVIAGLEKLTYGSLVVNDLNLDFKSDFFKNEIVFLSKPLVFLQNKTVLENVKYAYYIRNKKNTTIDFNSILNEFDLTDIKDKKVKTLSCYEKVKVAIARASLREFTFLLADELFADLSQSEVMQIVKYIKKLKFATLILTSKLPLNIEGLEFKSIKLNAGYVA